MNAVEVLRRVNEEFAGRGWTDQDYTGLVQEGMVRELQGAGPSAGDTPVPPLPAWARPLVAARSRQRVEVIERLGIDVVGDPACLLLPEQPPASEADLAPDRVSVDAAALAVTGVVARALEREQAMTAQLRKARRRPTAAPTLADAGRRALLRELWHRQTARWRRPR
jgi:hypothetical protein